MEDRDTNPSILVDVRMPHLRCEFHFGWLVGEIGWEGEERFEEASFVEGAVGAHYEDVPFVHVAVVDEAYGDEIDWVFGKLIELSLEQFCSVVRHFSLTKYCRMAIYIAMVTTIRARLWCCVLL